VLQSIVMPAPEQRWRISVLHIAVDLALQFLVVYKVFEVTGVIFRPDLLNNKH